MTFWDFCAPFYDRAEHTNTAYIGMLRKMKERVPQGASVFEAAAGTGSISLDVSDKADKVLCTDISERMLNVARKKAERRGIKNVTFAQRSLFDTGEANSSYEVIGGNMPIAVAVWTKRGIL
jgi:ubiquinone/menaquinone biosynthesis C-methylase UbiE